MRTRVPMPTLATTSGGASSPSAVNRLPTTRRASCSLGFPLLGVEVDQQDHVRHVLAERGLDGVVHLHVGVDRALALHATQSYSRSGLHGQAVVGG